MLELLPMDADHVVAMRASGRVTADDLQRAIDAIEHAKKIHPRVSLYVEIDDMRWMTFTALLRDLGYGLTQIGERSHYHRIAILTEQHWMTPIAKLENHLFKPMEVRVFSPRHKVEAIAWVAELPHGPSPAASETRQTP
ncbi:STAS/SEC14 domain-containing protein [Halomonas cerina]|uniref:STAS/SEC14 domain-containing protein n=1 Tax=Halomonas cerina TaxID=447424 RepID=A0A839V1L7_9GAMM|nr:STAS/SEC14 domain-containing protein [Halomonas cerina]MBB3189242.1 hypothetical protein [Halomonas cerina]